MKCISIFLIISLISCHSKHDEKTNAQYKQEVLDTERAFAQMAEEKGIAAAFLEFSAGNAVLLRGNQLFKGKEAIERYLNDNSIPDAKLEWAPDFVDVSVSGDLAYTYGHYTFSMMDSTGRNIQQSGIFHTVWKRQDNGTWRFVWD